MLHRKQLLVGWPGDRQQEYRWHNRFDVMLDRSTNSQKVHGFKLVGVALRAVTDMPSEHLYRTRAIHMMFVHASAGFHRYQNCSGILLLIQGFGMDPRGPGP